MTREKSARKLAKVFRDATDAIIIENPDGEVIDASHAAEDASIKTTATMREALAGALAEIGVSLR